MKRTISFLVVVAMLLASVLAIIPATAASAEDEADAVSFLPDGVLDTLKAEFEKADAQSNAYVGGVTPFAFAQDEAMRKFSGNRILELTLPVKQINGRNEVRFTIAVFKIADIANGKDSVPVKVHEIKLNAKDYEVGKFATIDLRAYNIVVAADETLTFGSKYDTFLPAWVTDQMPIRAILDEKASFATGIYGYAGSAKANDTKQPGNSIFMDAKMVPYYPETPAVTQPEGKKVTTVDEFKAAAQEGKAFYLGNDITLPADWTPVAFNGIFDGNGKTITLTGAKPVFGVLSGATLYNFTVAGDVAVSSAVANGIGGSVVTFSSVDVKVKLVNGDSASPYIPANWRTSTSLVFKNCNNYTPVTSNGSASAFVGGINTEGTITIEGCNNYANMSGKSQSGGFLGHTWTGGITIRNSNNGTAVTENTINTTSDAGGLIGASRGFVTIENCANYANVSGKNNVAGCLGCSENSGLKATNFKNYGTITASADYAAGLVGQMTTGNLDVDGFVNYGAINASENNAAGIVALMKGSEIVVKNSANYGAITAKKNNAAGVVAQKTAAGDIKVDGFTNYGAISSKLTGGAVGGWLYGSVGNVTLNNVHNFANVTSAYTGGLIGAYQATSKTATLTNCYNGADGAMVTIKGSDFTGGLLGECTATVYATNCASHATLNGVNGGRTGGLFAKLGSNAVMTGVKSFGTATNGLAIGGFVGEGGNIKVENAENHMVIVGGNGSYGGGIVAYLKGDFTANNVINYVDNKVQGNWNVIGGGFVGSLANSNITLSFTDCTNYASMTSGNSNYGGFVGGMAWVNNAFVAPVKSISFVRCTNNGNISSTGNVGGFVGQCDANSFYFEDCTNNGNITSTSNTAAGFMPYGSKNPQTATFINCTNNGNITANANTKGAAGLYTFRWFNGKVTLTNCVNKGTISATGGTAAGLVGSANNDTTLTDCSNKGTLNGKTEIDRANSGKFIDHADYTEIDALIASLEGAEDDFTADSWATFVKIFDEVKAELAVLKANKDTLKAQSDALYEKLLAAKDALVPFIKDDEGHIWALDHIEKYPTCIDEGIAIYKCQGHCGSTKEMVIKPSKHMHDFGELVKAKAVTCTESGISRDYYECKTCKKKFDSNNTDICKEIKENVVIDAKGHNYAKVESESTSATCIADGKLVEKCSKCGDVKTTVLEKTPDKHTVGDIVLEEVKATCEEAGKIVYVCKICGETATDVLEPTGHDFTKEDVINPTCTTFGYKIWFCENCGLMEKWEKISDPVGHTPYETSEKVEGTRVEPSCVSIGSEQYICGSCGTVLVKTLDKLEHKIETETVESTCKSRGFTYQYCTSGNCGMEGLEKVYEIYGSDSIFAIFPFGIWIVSGSVKDLELDIVDGHDWQDTIVNNATCTEDGLKIRYCASCAENTTASIPATGHSYLTWPEGTADKDKIPENSNEYKAAGSENLTLPTCTEKGALIVKCHNDGCTATDTMELEALGHDYKDADNGVKDPTCSAKAATWKECSRCHDIIDYDEISVKLKDQYTDTADAKKHHTGLVSEGDEEYHILVEGDCETIGLLMVLCKDCGKYAYIVRDGSGKHSEQPAHGSDKWIDGVEPSEPTCAAEGKAGKYVCTKCGETVTVGENKAKLPHTEVVDAAKDPTCTKTGLTQGKHCSVCNATIVKQEVVKEKGHTWENFDGLAATCDKDGYKEYRICKVCNVKEGGEVIPAGHDFQTVGTDKKDVATCTTYAYNHVKCTMCGEEFIAQDSFRAALGHLWNDGEQKAPTCDAEGGLLQTCTRVGCGETQLINKIDQLKHTNEAGQLLEGVCTADYTDVHCKFCGKDFEKAHIENVTNVPATCEKVGYEVITCTDPDCKAPNHIVKVTYTDALGHDYDDPNCKVVVTPETEEKDGLRRTYCVRCDSYVDEVIPATKKVHLSLSFNNPASGKANFADSSIIEVKVLLTSKMTEIRTLSFDLYFEYLNLELIDYVAGDIFTMSDINANGNRITFAGLSGETVFVGENAVVATLRFRVARRYAPAEAAKIGFAFADANANTTDAEVAVDHNDIDWVEVACLMDVDGNGVIDMNDAMWIYDLILESKYDVRADLDKNGVIEALDLKLLFNYLTRSMTADQIYDFN